MLRRTFFFAFALLSCVATATHAEEPLRLLPADRPIEQAIDHYIDVALKSEKVTPAPAAPDAEVLRRLSLDLNGRIPTVAELDAYLANGAPNKKVQLVDRLIGSPCFARHQTEEFAALLHGNGEAAGKGAKRTALNGYLQKSFADNKSWDRIFRDVMLPDETDPKKKGAGEFLKSRIKDVNRLTIDVSTTFFGVNVSCAQCHDHPHVPAWTQDLFYGMKGFFARTFENGGILAEYDAGVVKYVPNKGKEKIAPVMFISGKKLDMPNVREINGADKKKAQERISAAKKAKKAPALPTVSARAKLVETALEPGQREIFARAVVNRLWYRFYGRGLVMPLDQMHLLNPPSHPELLDWLARDLVEHQYDLRRLVRGMVLSKTYAQSSRWTGSLPPEKLFAVAQARPLTPMQMGFSLRLATTDPQSLPKAPAELEKRLEGIERSGAGLANFFPRPKENFQVSVGEAMLFANNPGIQKDLLEAGGSLVTRLMQLKEPAQRAELAVRSVLSRPAQANELKALTEYLRRRADRPAAGCQQVVWALLTSAEFRFNH